MNTTPHEHEFTDTYNEVIYDIFSKSFAEARMILFPSEKLFLSGDLHDSDDILTDGYGEHPLQQRSHIRIEEMYYNPVMNGVEIVLFCTDTDIECPMVFAERIFYAGNYLAIADTRISHVMEQDEKAGEVVTALRAAWLQSLQPKPKKQYGPVEWNPRATEEDLHKLHEEAERRADEARRRKAGGE